MNRSLLFATPTPLATLGNTGLARPFFPVFRSLLLALLLNTLACPLTTPWTLAQSPKSPAIDFNTQIRPILSNRCFACHGPDEATVESGLRLDSYESATQPADSGSVAVVANDPNASEVIKRVLAEDEQVRMPPPRFGDRLTAREVELLKAWIASGARYTKHWSYEKINSVATPDAPANLSHTPPGVSMPAWMGNPIDRHILSRLHAKGLTPSPEADQVTLLRRLTLDLTGLPPSLDEVESFIGQNDPLAYEKLVDRLLASPAYGEHWGRRWLDMARYADSAGYADDPARTIWAYRDWVVQAFNANMPFDQFTIEQLAGDLLENPTPDQLVATAFHRNTLTNNEGGTNDEEFRNVAIVDRVNTTMAVWMGVTMGCAQCHNHKYDPISQKEYFEVFSIFNQTEDADRGDESPTYAWFSPQQRAQRSELEQQIQTLDAQLNAPDASLANEQKEWETRLLATSPWIIAKPKSVSTQSAASTEISDDGLIKIDSKADNDSILIEVPLPKDWSPETLRGIRIETTPDPSFPGGGVSRSDGNIVLTSLSASLVQEPRSRAKGRFVRVELPGKEKILSLAEVQVFDNQTNLALQGKAIQSSEILAGAPSRAIDGNTSGKWEDNSVTHTNTSDSPWWEVDLGGSHPVDKIAVFNRIDNGIGTRLSGAIVLLLDENRNEVWRGSIGKAEAEHQLSLEQQVLWTAQHAAADHEQGGFPALHAIDSDPKTGWAVGGAIDKPHTLQVAGKAANPAPADPSTNPWIVRIQLGFDSQHKRLILSSFRIGLTSDQNLTDTLKTPRNILEIVESKQRTDAQEDSLHQYYVRQVTPTRSGIREKLAQTNQLLANLKPITSVPILRELAKERRRSTKIQLRGNYKVTGDEVNPGIPSIFGYQPDPENTNQIDRLKFAKWLVSDRNPLTARVLANRTWEQLFGVGIVRTSEEFGSQGDLPIYPELLDHLASDFMASGWDIKGLIRSIVLSNAYRQSSSVSREAFEADPENTQITRGPRFRVAAEQVRDMALASAGLLTTKFYGPPTRPPQPNMGLSAAFGSRTDWETSTGEDRYRRAIYTQWRRSNPYPSMTTFDAPTREVCVLKRDRTNTPLQALVTLNDPVYIEAAQGLARRVLVHDASETSDDESRLKKMFQLVLTRKPSTAESQSMLRLLNASRKDLQDKSDQAAKLATEPIGKLPEGIEPVELASWVLVGNVLLNLDEFLMTP